MFIRLTIPPNSERIAFNVEQIKTIQEYGKQKCLVNGILVNESYEEVDRRLTEVLYNPTIRRDSIIK